MKKLVLIFLVALSLLGGCQKQTQTQTLVPFERNDLWGYKDANSKVVIQPEFIFADPFSKYGLALVASPKEKGWVYIDRKGRTVIKPYHIDDANDCDHFAEGLSRYEENGKIGFFDERGKIRIKAQFEFASSFIRGYAAVAKEVRFEKKGELTFIRSEQWGFIDKKGRLIIPYQYEEIVEPFNEQGLAVVKKNGERMIINTKGELAVQEG